MEYTIEQAVNYIKSMGLDSDYFADIKYTYFSSEIKDGLYCLYYTINNYKNQSGFAIMKYSDSDIKTELLIRRLSLK